ncbi:carboxypeptidase-like regulatory domain-containing protein [Mucilaginibacter gynuensis]|uniref:Carboxypeptidase-like regulatory domain-containing protein n=1 Tax=Mucilaginibacter gynuensis TaxID=1302236 RepID=A0ABP8H163_9SPHI
MNKRTDISQRISQYLNGELDARAMHQLEREALHDPFLADAIEGYEKAATDQQTNLNDIQARLQQRLNPPVKRLIPWKVISIAASVLVVLTVGILVLNKDTKQSAQKPKIALAEKAQQTPPPPVDLQKKPDSATNDEVIIEAEPPAQAYIPTRYRAKKFAPPVVKESVPLFDKSGNKSDTTNALEEMVVMGYATQKKESTTSAVTTIKPSDVTVEKAAPALNNTLQGRVAGLSVSPADKNKIATPITGTVVDEQGAPIPGATVKVANSNSVSQTNAQGKFTLPVVPNQSVLDIAFIGFESKRVKVKNLDTLMIAMVEDKRALQEVVVSGYSRPKKPIKSAHPEVGWKEFNKYIGETAESPDGQQGTVKLSFIVEPDGDLSEFKILKSVSPKTDQQAIDLVQEGPKWIGELNGEPKEIKLSIKFRKTE